MNQSLDLNSYGFTEMNAVELQIIDGGLLSLPTQPLGATGGSGGTPPPASTTTNAGAGNGSSLLVSILTIGALIGLGSLL